MLGQSGSTVTCYDNLRTVEWITGKKIRLQFPQKLIAKLVDSQSAAALTSAVLNRASTPLKVLYIMCIGVWNFHTTEEIIWYKEVKRIR